jgi:hypothetical protein
MGGGMMILTSKSKRERESDREQKGETLDNEEEERRIHH